MVGGAGMGRSAARVLKETLIRVSPSNKRVLKERFTAFISEVLSDLRIISWGRLLAFRT